LHPVTGVAQAPGDQGEQIGVIVDYEYLRHLATPVLR
jgi:hypothetical protein